LSFVFQRRPARRDLHSFPTRRSSDLTLLELAQATGRIVIVHHGPQAHGVGAELAALLADGAILSLDAPIVRVAGHAGPSLPPQRSEEHTSELQSRENLVCRLLLEKKN